MMSNLVLTQQKFVLLVDKIGIECDSEHIIKTWLAEHSRTSYRIFPETKQKDIDFTIKSKPDDFPNLTSPTDIILQPLSKLLLTYNASSVFKLVNKLKKNQNVKQMFLWATPKNVSEHFVVPFLQYMSDMIVTFSDCNNVSILVRKAGGLVSNKNYSLNVQNGIFKITEVKKGQQVKQDIAVNPESLGTFKINLEEEELIARNALKLPYERASTKEGNIIYTPDADDDFDDEDPDEDLYI